MKKKPGGVHVLIVGIILLCLVLGYYYYLSNKRASAKNEETVVLTPVQEVLSRNLDSGYPPSPREVIKYFGDLTQCLHNEEYTEEEFMQLAMQIQRLYDEELIANQTQEQYISSLRWDVDEMKRQEITISSYSPASSTDVDRFDENGFEWARMLCSFTLRRGTGVELVEEVFLLRKDRDGHWKIYGWMPAEDVDGYGE